MRKPRRSQRFSISVTTKRGDAAKCYLRAENEVDALDRVERAYPGSAVAEIKRLADFGEAGE